jgi:retron-type reverse transcriptase
MLKRVEKTLESLKKKNHFIGGKVSDIELKGTEAKIFWRARPTLSEIDFFEFHFVNNSNIRKFNHYHNSFKIPNNEIMLLEEIRDNIVDFINEYIELEFNKTTKTERNNLKKEIQGFFELYVNEQLEAKCPF